jgi:D-serine dehydratase
MTERVLDASLLDHRLKGIPGGAAPFAIEEIGRLGWNLLREDLPLPAAVIRARALEHNSRWMQRYLALSGSVIAPHGKTTMSPQLFHRQLDDGAWGITISTVQQLQVCRDFGIPRVLMANQLIGRQAIRYVLDELERDGGFDFYCLVDSLAGVRAIATMARERSAGRPVQVLLEGGYAGGRTGCRDLATALEVSRAVKEAEPFLALRGVEGFEGMLMVEPADDGLRQVDDFLEFLIEIAVACETEELFAPGPAILTAGGSAFYDRVVAAFTRAGMTREVIVVTRSGCYLTHDSEFFERMFQNLLARSPAARNLVPGLEPALEVWSYVQSRPEPALAVLTMGKRDCGWDLGLPVPLTSCRPGRDRLPVRLGTGYAVTALNDQHAYLCLPPDSELEVGDLVACGISHPCTTFDRWPLLLLVDDDYDVVGAIRTYF